MAVDIHDYTVNLKGKDFVTYEGLLALAHEKGLLGVETSLIETPSSENANTAIVTASVFLPSPVDPDKVCKYTGIGDASPANVSRNITPHIIRMAETRAKARALRDAVNVGITAKEELGPDMEDEPGSGSVTPLREAQQQASAAANPGSGGPGSGGPKLASHKQINYLGVLADNQGPGTRQAIEQKIGKRFEQLTSNEARKLIDRLSGKAG